MFIRNPFKALQPFHSQATPPKMSEFHFGINSIMHKCQDEIVVGLKFSLTHNGLMARRIHLNSSLVPPPPRQPLICPKMLKQLRQKLIKQRT